VGSRVSFAAADGRQRPSTAGTHVTTRHIPEIGRRFVDPASGC